MEDGRAQLNGRAKSGLNALRPGAIVTGKPATNALSTEASPAIREPLTAGISAKGSPSPGIRVSVANKSGKDREIAKIEPPGKIGDFYDFGSMLGQGGFSTVSEILHAKTFQPFAGKVVQKWKSEQDIREHDAPFRKVMELLMNNEHANLVRMLHVFEDESNYYQVMEACQGGTLRRFIRSYERTAIPLRVVEDIIEQVALAIQFLHNLQVIHRDIKPDNVMLVGPREADNIVAGTRRITLNVVDFDMCRFLDEDEEVKTGHLEGTPGYLAPEVLETRRYSVKSDMFSFGCMTYFVMLHEEPCPEMEWDSTATHYMVSVLDRWTIDTLALCEAAAGRLEVVEDILSPSACSPASSRTARDVRDASPKDRTPKEQVSRPDSPASAAADGTEEVYEGFPARLWRLLAWCLALEPEKRPSDVRMLMLSGWIRGEVFSPKSPSPHTGPHGADSSAKRERRSKKTKASIDDLLRLSAATGPNR